MFDTVTVDSHQEDGGMMFDTVTVIHIRKMVEGCLIQ